MSFNLQLDNNYSKQMIYIRIIWGLGIYYCLWTRSNVMRSLLEMHNNRLFPALQNHNLHFNKIPR